MAFGNMLNFGAYFFLKYVIHRSDPGALDGQASPVSPLIMLPVYNTIHREAVFFSRFLCSLLGNSTRRHLLLSLLPRDGTIVRCSILPND